SGVFLGKRRDHNLKQLRDRPVHSIMKLPLVSGLFRSVLAVSLAAHRFTKDGWERVYPSAKEYGFTAMVSDGERILATGTDGNLYSSETGDIWIKVGDRVFQNVNRIVGGGNDRWVLLGDAGRIAVGSPQNGWDLRQINL